MATASHPTGFRSLTARRLLPRDLRGAALALLILALWITLQAVALPLVWNWRSPLPYLLILVSTHLYTGLFISAHDAMHGTLAPGRRWLNEGLGFVCALLLAFNWYPLLRRKHHLHHAHVVSKADPDYAHGGYLRWFASFASQYVTLWQILAVAATFNVLYRLFFPIENVILFWMLPSVLATLQLFTFGTYLPHRGEHGSNPYRSRSQRRNHLWAFLSCYFFGYHYEHHAYPATPWWLLWTKKPRTPQL